MPDASQLGLTERLNNQGRKELIDKDDSGKEYVAWTCAGKEFTPEDESLLIATSRDHSTPAKAVEAFTSRNAAVRREQERAQDLEWERAGEAVIRDMTLTQRWQWLRGFGDGQVQKGENGAAIPRHSRYVMGTDGNLVQVF